MNVFTELLLKIEQFSTVEARPIHHLPFPLITSSTASANRKQTGFVASTYMYIVYSTCVHVQCVYMYVDEPSSQYDAEPRMALRGVATRRVVHNFGEHARVRRTATTPIACVFGSEYTIIRRELDILVA